ncbi:MAG: hypothetical protein ACRDJM_02325, partial [Actinomycetota bacterium]
AAARVAVDQMVDRLAEDHENAALLAEGWAGALPGAVDPSTVETNMVFADLGTLDAVAVAGAMWEQGVRVGPLGANTIRAVLHKDVDRAGVERAVAAFASAVRP